VDESRKRILLIAASILAARKLAGGKRVPAIAVAAPPKIPLLSRGTPEAGNMPIEILRMPLIYAV